MKQSNETPTTTTTKHNIQPHYKNIEQQKYHNKQQQQQQQQLLTNTMPSTPENFNAFRKTIAASGGAFVTSFLVLPLDVIKTRLQFQVQKAGETPPFKGTLDGIKYIIRSEGIKALWRGLPPTLVMQIPASGIYYTLYDFLKQEFRKTEILNGYYAPFVSGCTARVIAAAITCPLEFVRTNMQAHSSLDGRVPRGAIATVKHSVAQRGWRSMWTGLFPTVIRDAPFSAIYWAMFEGFKDYLGTRWFSSSGGRESHTADPRLNFAAGSSAGMLAAAVTNPVDVVKTRMQGALREEGEKGGDRIRGTMDVVRGIVREEGMRPFVRGIVPRVMRVAPSCAIMISSYEIFKKTLHTP